MDTKDPEIVHNYREFAQARLGDPESTPYYLGRCLYKYTDCGPWSVYILDEPLLTKKFNPDELYYEDEEASDCSLADHIIGVKVGSIVEGSDAYAEPFTLMFPFDMEDFWKGVESVNEEASFYWERDNSSWYTLHHPEHGDFWIKECWGDWEWGTEAEEIPQEVKDAVQKWIGEDCYCFQHYNEPEPVPGLTDWTMEEWINDATF